MNISIALAVQPAVQYLTALFSPNDIVCLTFIHATKKYPGTESAVTDNDYRPLSEVITAKSIERLIERNKNWHVYVSMAPFKPGSKNRTKANILEARHVFIDADENGDAVLAALRAAVAAEEVPTPTVIVQSSPHKYQFVWNVVGFTIPEQEAMNRTLQQKFGTDAQATDAARVLRIPGFRNIKPQYGDPKPVAELVEYNEPPFWGISRADFNIPLTSEPDNTVYSPVSDATVQQSIELLEAAMNAASVSYTRRPWEGSGGAYKFLLALCPWRENHSNGGPSDAMAFVQPSGAYGFKCLHAHCSDKNWNEFRAHLEALAGRRLSFKVPESSRVSDAPVEIVAQEAPMHKAEDRPDIPRAVLSGRLGEMCEREMLDDFPVSYAWLALVTAASVLVPERPSTGNGDNLHNLYTALVGPVNFGKSQAIEWAVLMLRLKDDLKRYDEVKAGSAERLLRYMNQRVAKGDLGPRVLMSLDEWKFFFDKAGIENSTFPTLLTTGFYKRNVTILDNFGRPMTVPTAFSWIGGIVTDSYDDCLSSVTSLGLHDRLLQGINPSSYTGFNYRPFEGNVLPADFEPQPVQMDKSVWECLKAWRKANPMATRESEIALRVAEICASFDGAPVLYGKDLGPHLILADEQMKLRQTLKPNIGETPDAQCAIKVENYLQAHGPAGEWISVRVLMRDIHADRFGPSIFRRTLDGLSYLKVTELGTLPAKPGNRAGGRPASAIRLVLD